MKLIQETDRNGNPIPENTTLDQGIDDIKNIFNNHFSMSELDFKKLKKHKDRLIATMTKWGKNRGCDDRDIYLKTFSVNNWLALDQTSKLKHSVFCKECETTHLELHAKYPVTSPVFSVEKQRISTLVEQLHDGNLKQVCENLKPKLKCLLDKSFSDLKHDNSKNKINK